MIAFGKADYNAKYYEKLQQYIQEGYIDERR